MSTDTLIFLTDLLVILGVGLGVSAVVYAFLRLSHRKDDQ